MREPGVRRGARRAPWSARGHGNAGYGNGWALAIPISGYLRPAGLVPGIAPSRYYPCRTTLGTPHPRTAWLDHLTGTPQACPDSTFGLDQGDPRGR